MMKNLLLAILVLGMNFSYTNVLKADDFTIQGFVTVTADSLPGDGVPVDLSSASGLYSALATADMNGFYSHTFTLPNGTSEAFTISTFDFCTGDMVGGTVTSFDGVTTLDINICNLVLPPPPNGAICDPFFDAMPDWVDPLTVYFTDLSFTTEPINAWSWDFGDGNTSTAQNPDHTYADYGFYDVTLTITTDSCTSDVIFPVMLDSFFFPSCQADFDFAADPNDPLTYNFFDLSTGNGVVAWSWDFGDGNTSTDQNPIHQYANAGSYPVTLFTLTTDSCFSIATDYVFAGNGMSCVADFEFFNDPFFPLEVMFWDNSITTSGVLNWSWDFGDGTTTTNDPGPFHVFPAPGIYDVSLMIETFDGCVDTVTMTVDLSPVGSACQAYFASSITPSNPSEYSFQDLSFSLSGVNSYAWDFGDGNSSTIQNPVHIYANNGAFNVSLTISDSTGCSDTYTEQVYVDDTCYASMGYFALDSTTLQFDVYASPFTTSVLWDFGDGTTSTDFNPVHVFPATGTYTVSVTITTSFGCTYTVTNSVIVDGWNFPFSCVADFEANIDPVDSMTVNFDNNSVALGGNVLEWFWDFGDGGFSTDENPTYTYTQSGLYHVNLFFITMNGCLGETSVMVQIGNGGVINIPDCQSFFGFDQDTANALSFNFLDYSYSSDPITSWAWDFGDGNTSTAQNPSHTYTTNGTYVVTLTITTATCSSYFECWIFTDPNVWYQDCEALFLPVGDSSEVFFVNLSFGDIVTTDWDFGDGTTSTEFEPVHTFPDAVGTYTVTLTITTLDGCTSTYVMTINQGDGNIFGLVPAPPTSTEEAEETVSILGAFPNPVIDVLTVSLDRKDFKAGYISVVSLNGQEMMREAISAGNGTIQTQMDMSQLSSGMYLIQVVNENNVETLKVVKQ